MPRKPRDNRASLRWHAFLSLLVVSLIGGGLGWWSVATEIAGAVVANGAIIVDGGSKRVQHPDGGIVTSINVRNEDHVRAGDVLIELDGTSLEASREVIVSQQRDAYAREVRLSAEADGSLLLATRGNFPALIEGEDFDRLLKMQQGLLDARASSIQGQKDRIKEKIAQLHQQLEGLDAQLEGNRQQQALLRDDKAKQQELLDDGLVGSARVNDLKREDARLTAEIGRIQAAKAEASSAIVEQGVALAQLDDDFRAEVLKDLQVVNGELAQLSQQRIAIEDQLSRLSIRAPQSGVVHQSIVQTVGGVVGAGETLMMIVPALESAAVDVRLSPLDVDKVHDSQPVIVRLTSLEARTTPDLTGQIRSVAPDLVTDQRTGVQYYVARIDIPLAELGKLPEGTHIMPGMPAEAFIRTGNRSVIAYLMKPLTDQLERAFRED